MFSMNIHIFYNGSDFHAPDAQLDTWNNYKNENSPRLFLACADSWRRQGWNVVRVTTDLLVYPTKSFEFKGILRRDLHRYNYSHWNVWHVWKKLAPCYVCNMDVFNFGFTADAGKQLLRHDAMAMHTNGWTGSIGFVTKEFCERVIETINKFDLGQLERAEQIAASWPLLIDDNIVRQFYPPPRYVPLCTFAHIKNDAHKFPLTQFARSTILRSLRTIPCEP